MLARARREWGQQQFEAAEQSLINVLRLAPDEPDAIRLLGMVVQRLGKHREAIECFRRVLTMGAEDSDLRIGLGISLFEQGEADEALTHFRQACTLEPCLRIGLVQSRRGTRAPCASRTKPSRALQRALELDPAHVSARLSLARAQANLGEVDAAVAEFREVLRRDPANAEGWFGLSNLNVVRFEPGDAASLQGALRREDLSHRDRELLGFSFAKALESQGDYAQAFDAFRAANASRRRRVRWDAAGEHRRAEAIQRVFADEPRRPSMPDSGTKSS